MPGRTADSEMPLPRVAHVPSFTLTERSGRTVTDRDLLGRVWVADFFFTLCSGPCPTLSLRMRSLQESIRRFEGKVKLVSFSVDPTYDRPPVLRAYANRYHADADLWWFLTADDEETMYAVVRNGFMQAVSRASKTAPVIHSTRFVLVDAEGYIRAWFNGEDAASKPKILRAIERLLAEASADQRPPAETQQ